jgi:tRNA pseudouridine55 synthase
MDGVLLIDKPSGPTSHDVVARLRATSGERSIGHTGTLDPLATGLLPLVLGRATRLSRFLTGRDKTYEADIWLGVSTDTDDALGQPVGIPAGSLPDDSAIDRALEAFRGTFGQVPPDHSAKKIGGRKAYELARKDEAVPLKPVTVTVSGLEPTGRGGNLIHVRLTATAGFYVRALARDLGRALGCGAHLAALRRTRIGAFAVERALPLAEAERLGGDIRTALMSPAEALADLPAVQPTEAGLTRARHGNSLGLEHLQGHWIPPQAGRDTQPIRILSAEGELIGVAHARGGLLHPAVVLG